MSFQFSLNAIRFEDVRAEVVKFLTENGTYDAQFDFEGSNLSYVIDTMAYTTMLMSYMLSTIANDNFLDTTTLRKNAVSIAKTLGYKPKRVQTSRIEGTFTYRPGDVIFGDESKLTIPPNTVFTGTDYGQMWTNADPIVLSVNPRDPFELTSASNPATPRVTLEQGIWRKFNYLGNGKNLQSFVIPAKNIDENNMKVSVYTTQDGEATKIEWTYAKTFFQIQNDQIYFVEEDIVQEGSPEIIFGNGIIGRPPAGYETVVVDYLETVGPEANNESDLEIPSGLVLNKSFDIASVDSQFLDFEPAGPSFGRQNYETLEDIKANAPRFFAAAGRAVTANDFETLILNEFGFIVDALAVFGGDELEPGNRDFLGNSYIAATPASAEAVDKFTDNLQIYLTETSETEIISALRDAGIIATQKFFLKPSYIYLQVEPTIELSARISSAERKNTEEQAFDVLDEYFKEEFNGFGIPYRESKVRSQVDALEQVISTEIDTKYGFVLNNESFYTDRATLNWLPVRFQRTETGEVDRDDQGVPITTNFVKKNLQIAQDYDAGSQSKNQAFRITIDNLNRTTVDRRLLVWHGRDVENGTDLEQPWTPWLKQSEYKMTIDFNQSGANPAGGEVVGFHIMDNGLVYTTWTYLTDATTPFDGTVFANDFITRTSPFLESSVDPLDPAIVTITRPRSFNIKYSDYVFDATAFSNNAQSVFYKYISDGTTEEILNSDTIQSWVMYINDTAVALVYANKDRSLTMDVLDQAEDFLTNIVELRPTPFTIDGAEPLSGIPYHTINIHRWYAKEGSLGLLPEEVRGTIWGKTGIHGSLTHPDLDRYLFNTDAATEDIAELVVYERSGNKSLFQEMFSFKGSGSNFYTTSLSWDNIDESGNNTYSLFLNNTLSDDRQKVSTMIWNKSESGINQFQFITRESEATWLEEQGFFVDDSQTDATTGETIYKAFTITVDENGVYSISVQLSSDISAIKVREKNLLFAFTTPVDSSTYYDIKESYTRSFTNSETLEKTPLILAEDTPGVLTVEWGTDNITHLFNVVMDSTEFTGFNTQMISPDDFRQFGLRTELKIEPYPIITTNESGDVVTVDGYGVFCYGIFHNSTIGTFEYEGGDVRYLRILEGNYLGGSVERETAQISIRDFFDNYGNQEDDVKMDIITIVPDNDYEIDESGVEVIVGTQTDFDSIYTQTVRADILPVESVLI